MVPVGFPTAFKANLLKGVDKRIYIKVPFVEPGSAESVGPDI